MDTITAFRIQELEEKIQEARQAYEAGAPIVSDEVYDAWYDELRELKASSPAVTSVGAPVPDKTPWKKARHGVTMGSLNKVNTPDELRAWASKHPNQVLFNSEKLDGASLHLRYEDGKLVQGITRGDGVEGEDITRNALKMRGVPQSLPESFTGSVRAEIMLYKEEFAKIESEGYVSPRNAAAGIARRYDGKGCELLDVMSYQVMDGKSFTTEVEQFEWLMKMGFMVPGFGFCSCEGTIDTYRVYESGYRDDLPYEIDGLVVRFNDVAYQLSLGEENQNPVGAIAFKFSSISREATIERFDWQVGGTGRITPVAVFTPVKLYGATVTNASVYNVGYIRQLGLGVGAKVLVTRANDVIPRILTVVEKPASVESYPTKCPACDAPTEEQGEYIVCPNAATCPAQAVGRVKRYIKALDILEWGDVLIESLVEQGIVKNVPDLYTLTVEDLTRVERISKNVANKLLKNLWAKNPIPLEKLLGALSIPGCADSTVQIVMDAGYDTLPKMKTARVADLSKVPGLGPVKSQALADWLKNESHQVETMIAHGVKVKDRIKGNLTGKSFCFTGSMKTKRGDLEAMVQANGGVVKTSVSKGLTYLVMADANSTSSKAQAARKNGTTCLSENDFLAMVQQG